MNNIGEKIASNISAIVDEGYLDEDCAALLNGWLADSRLNLWISRYDEDGNTLLNEFKLEAYLSSDCGVLDEISVKFNLDELVDEELDANTGGGVLDSDSVPAFLALAVEFEKQAAKLRAAISKSTGAPA